jgi:subtilisin-like proprotein convertase family protein
MLAFADRTKGGRWWLFVSDNQGGDRFSLTSWAVHLKNTPVSITPTSWGQLKAIYR